MITGEQAEEIKKQIISQMENFPSLQKEQAIQQINAMNNEQLEQFLIQNKLIKPFSVADFYSYILRLIKLKNKHLLNHS